MPTRPTFTVVVATFDRGRAIEPTLLSVARQSVADLEVLVVSDGPPADGLRETVEAQDDRFRLLALPERTRSQSGPNNLGWAQAAGPYVAYLGHDDVWAPEHLADLLAVLERDDAEVAVAGCLYLGPPGTEDQLTWVTGLFDPDDAWQEHFFPPSSIAHRRDLPIPPGSWPDAGTSRLPVDSGFELAAIDAGCRFVSTGRISVFKLASALRYLSYLAAGDEEQRALLELSPEDREALVARSVEAARARGKVMATLHARPEDHEPGQLMRRNERTRGIDQTRVDPLVDSVWIDTDDEPRGLDWHGADPVSGDPAERRWRWSGPSSHPRLPLPYAGPDGGRVHVRLHVRRFADAEVRDGLTALLDGSPVELTLEPVEHGGVVHLAGVLRSDRPTVLELRMPHLVLLDDETERRVGLALVGIELETDLAMRARGASVPGTGPSRALLIDEHERLEARHRAVEQDAANSLVMHDNALVARDRAQGRRAAAEERLATADAVLATRLGRLAAAWHRRRS